MCLAWFLILCCTGELNYFPWRLSPIRGCAAQSINQGLRSRQPKTPATLDDVPSCSSAGPSWCRDKGNGLSTTGPRGHSSAPTCALRRLVAGHHRNNLSPARQEGPSCAETERVRKSRLSWPSSLKRLSFKYDLTSQGCVRLHCLSAADITSCLHVHDYITSLLCLIVYHPSENHPYTLHLDDPPTASLHHVQLHVHTIPSTSRHESRIAHTEQKEWSCQHHYHLVESWCPKYIETERRCPPTIVSKQYW